MKATPILFSAPMVRAILEGRKTQTRRVMKTQPECCGVLMNTPGGDLIYLWPHKDVEHYCKCPYGVIGDRLWVRETFAWIADELCVTPGVAYKADGTVRWAISPKDGETVYNAGSREIWKYKPSIFMPRKASRITLEITNVRVERIQDISELDARAEGVVWQRDFGDGIETRDARVPFGDLWHALNDSRGFGWNVNPWVWVIEFRKES